MFSTWPSLLLAGTLLSAVSAYMISIRSAADKINFANELRIKSEEIARLNGELFAVATGGNSFGYLLAGPPSTALENCPLSLVHEGKYPVYDVVITIVDLTELEILRREYMNFDLIEAPATTVLKPGNIAPGQTLKLDPFQLMLDKRYVGSLIKDAHVDSHDFDVTITSRNTVNIGPVSQKFRFKRDEKWGEWLLATKLERNGETIEESVPDQFPAAPNDGSIW